jgi:hypothetical protein
MAMQDGVVTVTARWAALFAVLACGTAMAAGAAEAPQPDGWAVNVYGFSYHFERDLARRIDADNEFNPGLGLRTALWKSKSGRQRVQAEAGVYYDSGERWAKTADVTYQYRVFRNFWAGAGLFFFHTRTYNRGDPVLVPLPIVAYDLGWAELNLAYAPKWGELNQINTLGAFLTWKLN